MKIICGIYTITNNINKKKYVGLSKNCIKRWYEHKENAKRPKKPYQFRVPLYNAMRKYGIDNFTFEIIEECSQDELKEREIYWIKELDTYKNGYNATLGGDLPEGHILRGEEHGMSKLTEEDVVQCRKWYKEGKRAIPTWKKYYKDKINKGGFQRMWHGQTWKHVMPEVFENNPHPRSHITEEQIIDIREKSKELSAWQIYNLYYKGIIGYASIWDIIHYSGRFQDKEAVSTIPVIGK